MGSAGSQGPLRRADRGLQRGEHAPMTRRPVEIGERFWRLIVLEREELLRPGGWTFRCRCDCGTEVDGVRGKNLRSTRTRSCGCLKRERVAERNWRHGLTHRSSAYRSWQS